MESCQIDINNKKEKSMHETKSFHIRDILSVSTGYLYGDVDGLYSVVSHLAGGKVSTIGLMNYADSARQSLYCQLPWLKSIEPLVLDDDLSDDECLRHIDDWICEIADLYGEFHNVKEMSLEEKPKPGIFNDERLNYSKKVQPEPKAPSQRKVTAVRKLNVHKKW